MAGKKVVHFGGGNIGRGFIAEFFHKSGYEVVFVDVMDNLIEQIQKTPSYTVTEIGTDDVKSYTIDNYRALNSKHSMPQVIQEIASADVVTCAVGPNILKFIAKPIANGIDARTKDSLLTVLACENAIGATDTLLSFIKPELKTSEADLAKKVVFPNSAIDRIVPVQDDGAGLNVKIEKFFEWCVESKPYKNANAEHPDIFGIHWVDDLEPYIERKLFTVNTSHATAAYYGHNRNKRTIHESMADKDIHDIVRAALKETAHLIVTKHGISPKEQDDYVESIITRISNPHLEDVVERVGRAPLRKLGRKERFIGPAFQLAERDESVDALLGGVEMALRFQNVEGDEESKELASILKSTTSAEATEKLCGLTKSDKLYNRVEKVIAKVQAGN